MTSVVQEGSLVWTPSAKQVEDSEIARYMSWLRDERRLDFADYASLWQWSVRDTDAFWQSIWDFFDIVSEGKATSVSDAGPIERTRWFPGARVNFAEHMLRFERRAAAGSAALYHSTETSKLAPMAWRELGDRVRQLATRMRAMGIAPGDRIGSYMPNVPETVIAMLATVAIGAVWSSAAPEFGPKTVIDRLGQIEPRWLFAADGYMFNGKPYDRRTAVQAIRDGVPAIERVIWLPFLADANEIAKGHEDLFWNELFTDPAPSIDDFAFTRVECDHPLWVLFSSGTTGLPKAIVHGHVGILLEAYKLIALHGDYKAGETIFFYTTTGWMMWNSLLFSLLLGVTVILYDGNPFYPDLAMLWKMAEATKANHFGVSPTLVQMLEKAGYVPKDDCDLSAMKALGLGGAPATPRTYEWIVQNVKPEIWIACGSGGTELCSAWVGGVAIQPVFAGEMQARCLGMAVKSVSDDGEELIDAVGELVVTKASPSMPLYFWNDPGGRRFHETYFSTFPGWWRHGDLLKINERGGAYIYGRSDATLNRNGVRIGSAEIYNTLAEIDEIADGLIVCLERPNGEFFMPLFIAMKPGRAMDGVVVEQIKHKLRTQNSPRHVPDTIVEAPGIPYTLSGKRMEVPVRRILMGAAPDAVASPDAMKDPALLDWYAQYGRSNAA